MPEKLLSQDSAQIGCLHHQHIFHCTRRASQPDMLTQLFEGAVYRRLGSPLKIHYANTGFLCWHLGLFKSIVGGLCIIGCLTASLASTH